MSYYASLSPAFQFAVLLRLVGLDIQRSLPGNVGQVMNLEFKCLHMGKSMEIKKKIFFSNF